MGDPLSIERSLSDVFSKGLPEILGEDHERRAGQLEMAIRIARSIEGGEIAVIEAGTGLGKSLAYLIPLLMYCGRSGSRAVVSTHTRTLQRQLIEKDFPQAKRATGMEIDGVVLLGRTNYVCKLAIRRALERGDARGESEEWLRRAYADERGELEKLDSGALQEAALRAAIACPSSETICAGCRLRDECHLLRARRRALSSQVVFANHALLFSDIAARGALLGEYDVLIIDEAHHLDEIATRFSTLSFSRHAIRGSPRSLLTKAYEEIAAYAREVLAAEHSEARAELETLWSQFNESLEAADRAVTRLFQHVGRNAGSFLSNQRYASPSGPRGPSLCYREGSPLLYGIDAESSEIKEKLNETVSAATSLREIACQSAVLAETVVPASLYALGETARELSEISDFVLTASDEAYVFYAETSVEGTVTSLAAAPIDVSVQLGALLEEVCRAAVLTSATLALGDDFSYTLGRLGISGSPRVVACRFESPFDLERQRAVLLASFVPEPGSPDYLERAARVIRDIAKTVRKKMLVLCTSKGQLNGLFNLLERDKALRPQLLAQLETSSRSDLVSRFRQGRGQMILLGLASFWEGVDFPGELLEIVVVAKMPFLVPTEPVIQARAGRCRELGEDPFWELILPDAILKLRQGLGRLIRTSSDRGAVILLDARLKERAYGDPVLKAISERAVRCDQLEDLLGAVERIFRAEPQR